jgi:hypothetical protein
VVAVDACRPLKRRRTVERKELGDFNLYELTLGRGRYVEGFARAVTVTSESFKEL